MMASAEQGRCPKRMGSNTSVEERPIRPDHARIGREGSSVDEVAIERVEEALSSKPIVGGFDIPQHPLGVLLSITTEGGDSVSHPAFGIESVKDLCARRVGKRPERVSRLNTTDFLVEFQAGENPTLFATGMGRKLQWQHLKLFVDCYIAAIEILDRISREREEARRIIDDQHKVPIQVTPPANVKPPTPEAKVDETQEKEAFMHEKEDAMLKVLESMSKKIEKLESLSKANSVSTSGSEVSGRGIKTPSLGSLMGGAQRRDGVYLMEQLPRVGNFSGEKPIPKGEIDFKTWKGDVLGNLQNYPETSLRQGVRSSLRGNAKELLEGLPPGATISEIVEVLTRQYGTVESSDQLLSNFYQMVQFKGEEVANFAARLVGALNKIQRRFPHLVPQSDRDVQLKERLFHGMAKPLRDALRYMYGNKDVGYFDLLEEARKVQECDEKVVNVKSKGAGVETDTDDLGSLRDEVAELTAVMKAAKTNGPPMFKGKRDNRNLKGPQVTSAGPFRGKFRPVQCWQCDGWGHVARECPSPENYPRGEENTQGPPPEKQSQEKQEKAPTQNSQTPNQ